MVISINMNLPTSEVSGININPLALVVSVRL